MRVSTPTLRRPTATTRYSLAFQSPVAGAFTLVGAAQMAVWSRGKLKRYKRKFKDEPLFKARHALIPGVY